MRVAVVGATGFVGAALLPALRAAGHEPVVLTRGSGRAGGSPDLAEVRAYDPAAGAASLATALDGVGGVVNLAGANLFQKRWSRRFKRTIEESRVGVTRSLVQAFDLLDRPPEVLVNASAVGVYGPRDPDETVDEDTLDATTFAPRDFLQHVCLRWERAAEEATRRGVRVVCLRIGIVFGPGGALAAMARPIRFFVGGPLGSGRQIVSWIHREDLCAMVRHVLEQKTVEGPWNAVTPTPVSNGELTRALARFLHRPSWLRTPRFLLRIAVGQAASALVGGQRVRPARALACGFRWRHEDLAEAIESALAGGRFYLA